MNPDNGQVLFKKIRKIIEGKSFNYIMDVWLFEYDGEVDLSNATTDEVAQVAWMNRKHIKELLDANMFVDAFRIRLYGSGCLRKCNIYSGGTR